MSKVIRGIGKINKQMYFYIAWHKYFKTKLVALCELEFLSKSDKNRGNQKFIVIDYANVHLLS